RVPQEGPGSNEIAELRHRDPAQRECWCIVAQRDPLQGPEGVARHERTRRGGDQRIHGNPVTLVTPRGSPSWHPIYPMSSSRVASRRRCRTNGEEEESNMVDILHRVGIKSSLDDTYKALATREGIAAWWTNKTQGESKIGGVLQFRFGA